MRLAQQTALRKHYYQVKRHQRLENHRRSLEEEAPFQARYHLRKYSEVGESQKGLTAALCSPLHAPPQNPIRVISALEVDRSKHKSEESSIGEDSLVLPTDPTVSLADERLALTRYVTMYVERHKELPPTTLQYYQLGQLIGKGAFGKVITAVHKLTGHTVAIKTIEKSLMAEESRRKKIFQEVLILSKIRDKRIIRLLEVFESKNHLLIITEYANGGDLLHYTKSRGRLPEDEAKQLLRELVEGLQAVHRAGVLHRDIKLENILLSRSHVKICDFGVSRMMPKHALIREQCGTPAYIAPEVLGDRGYEGFASDIWSLGVCLYAMVSGFLPFQGKTASELHAAIMSGQVEMPEFFSSDLQDLLIQLFRTSPKQRISLKSLLVHPWLSSSLPVPSEGKSYHELKELGKD
jgi:serine/threonine protein kinase